MEPLARSAGFFASAEAPNAAEMNLRSFVAIPAPERTAWHSYHLPRFNLLGSFMSISRNLARLLAACALVLAPALARQRSVSAMFRL